MNQTAVTSLQNLTNVGMTKIRERRELRDETFGLTTIDHQLENPNALRRGLATQTVQHTGRECEDCVHARV